jgi:hypothetical protein
VVFVLALLAYAWSLLTLLALALFLVVWAAQSTAACARWVARRPVRVERGRPGSLPVGA